MMASRAFGITRPNAKPLKCRILGKSPRFCKSQIYERICCWQSCLTNYAATGFRITSIITNHDLTCHRHFYSMGPSRRCLRRATTDGNGAEWHLCRGSQSILQSGLLPRNAICQKTAGRLAIHHSAVVEERLEGTTRCQGLLGHLRRLRSQLLTWPWAWGDTFTNALTV